MSEPIPEKQDSSIVKLVANNIDSYLSDTEKNLVILFYAPWCGHCIY